MKRWGGVLSLSLILLGCQSLPPSQIYETQVLSDQELASSILIDARAPFQASVNELPQSIKLRWEDFAAQDLRMKSGQALEMERRRLARLGISPSKSLLLFADLPQDQADVGRLAWTLKVMGLDKIKVLPLSSYKLKGLKKNHPGYPAEPYWLAPNSPPGVLHGLNLANLKDYQILDVRAKAEQTAPLVLKRFPQLASISIPFESFFPLEKNGKSVSEILKKQNIFSATKLILVSNRGVKAGAVGYLLTELGYSQVLVLEGGIQAQPQEFAAK